MSSDNSIFCVDLIWLSGAYSVKKNQKEKPGSEVDQGKKKGKKKLKIKKINQ